MLRNPHNNLPLNSPQPGQGAASPDVEAAGFTDSPASATPARISRPRKAAGVAGRAPAAFSPYESLQVVAKHEHLFIRQPGAQDVRHIAAEIDEYVFAEWGDETGLELLTDELSIDVTELDEIPRKVRGLIPHENIKGWDGDEYNAFPFDAYRDVVATLELDGEKRQVALYRIEVED